MIVVIIVVVVVLILALGLWGAYNALVKKRNRTQEAWSEIDVELKRRHDLIPNLVSTVEGYASHERGTFEAVTAARANAVSAGATGDPTKIAPAENALSGALRSLFAVAENYPQLRAVESFVQLQETLTATEDKIEYARRYYNTSARDYNISLQSFPRNLIAGERLKRNIVVTCTGVVVTARVFDLVLGRGERLLQLDETFHRAQLGVVFSNREQRAQRP